MLVCTVPRVREERRKAGLIRFRHIFPHGSVLLYLTQRPVSARSDLRFCPVLFGTAIMSSVFGKERQSMNCPAMALPLNPGSKTKL